MGRVTQHSSVCFQFHHSHLDHTKALQLTLFIVDSSNEYSNGLAEIFKCLEPAENERVFDTLAQSTTTARAARP